MRQIVRGVLVALVMVGCSGGSDTIDVTPTPPPTEVDAAVTPLPQADDAPIGGEAAATDVSSDGLFPVVVDASATATTSAATSWQVAVTLSSEYDSPERYADAWRVLDGNDNELGIRVLTHDHAGEQPFTRSATIEIPAELDRVFIEGRDQANGWSGERFELSLTRN